MSKKKKRKEVIVRNTNIAKKTGRMKRNGENMAIF
jgi:hypothetical protein